ncbi:MAG: PAS domain-containing protein [Vicinamibacterales bacterium]
MLSRRLVLFAGAAFFPLAAVLAHQLYQDRQDSVVAARDSLLRATRLVSARHRQLIERTEAIAAVLAALPVVRRGDVPLVNGVFAEVVRQFPEYPNVRLSSLDGRMLASALPGEPATSNAKRDWFEEVIRTSSYAMSGYFMGVTTGRPVVVLGYPVFGDDHRLASVLSVTIDLHGLAEASEHSLPRGARVTVIGRSGTVLASSVEGGRDSSPPVHPELLRAVRTGAPEGILETGDSGRPWITGFVSLPVGAGSEGMSVALAVPRDELLAPVSRGIVFSSAGATLAVALLFTFVAAGGRRLFVSPVRALEDVMSRLAGGDLHARPDESLLRDTSEFGRLARSLHSVGAQFQAREVTQAAERERLRAIFDAFFGFATLLSPDGLIQEINAAPPGSATLARDQLLGRPFTEAGALPPEMSAAVNGMIGRAAAGEAVRAEIGPVHGSGRHRWLSVQFSPIRDGSGRTVNVVGFGIDITERREAEDALRLRERELAAIYENSPHTLFYLEVVQGERFRVLSVNAAFLRATGLTSEQVIGRFLEDVVPAHSVDEVLERYRSAIRLRRIEQWEEVSDHPTGRKVGLVSIAPVFDRVGVCTHLIGSVYDNTAFRASQDALRASEERLRLALRAARQGFYDLDLRTGDAQVNDDYALMLGHDPASFSETNARWMERLHPDDHGRVIAQLQAYLTGRSSSYEVEFRQRTASGGWKWILSVGAIAARGADGTPTRLIGTHLDITARVDAEQALRQSESRLREAQRLAQVGNWELDLMTGQLHWSDELFRIFEVDRSSFKASYEAFLDAVHPADRARVDESYMASVRDGRPYRLTHRLLMPGGRVKYIEEQGETEFSPTGRPIRSRGTAQDVTDRMRVEEALRLSEANLRRAESLARLGHFEFDFTGDRPVWSEGLRRLCGHADGEVPGGGFFELAHPDDRDRVVTAMRQALALGHSCECDFRLVRRDGVTLHVRARGEPVAEASTGRLRFFGAMLDISGMKRAEQRLTELNATLEQRVVERTLELEATNRELESFSYSVSHDLRAPLRSIDGFSLALLQDESARLSERGRSDLQRIRGAAQRMGELVDALLRLSRLLREPMDLEAVDVSALVRDVVVALDESAPGLGGRISVAEGLVVRGDRRLLRAVFSNLIENAVKFSAHVPDPRVEVRAEGSDGQPVIVVRDNGAGFDMAYADKLFAPFERLHPPGQFPGSGIGLTTVHRIVSRHGGRVWARSQPGHGASFFLQLARP